MRSCQDWSFVCYARDGERRAVPQNGETSQKCGVYKGDCCWAEIVINVGSIFPDCPNHPKFTTMWKPVVDGKISRVTGKKSESDPQRTLRIAVSSTRRLDGSNWRNGNKAIPCCGYPALHHDITYKQVQVRAILTCIDLV